MTAIVLPDHRAQTIRYRWTSVIGSLIAAALFLGSALLQLMAAFQRWGGSWMRDGTSIEDHLYDYSFPWDPWESIGTAAQQFGAGTLLLALGVLVMPLSVMGAPRADAPRGVTVALIVVEIVLAVAVAGWFVIHGTHAVLSGLAGTPSPLQETFTLGLVGVIGLIALSALWGRVSGPVMLACVFLIGATGLGYLVATYLIAPILFGGSHDTAPWTEGVVALSTAGAGVTMIFAARAATRPTAPRRDSEVRPHPPAWSEEPHRS